MNRYNPKEIEPRWQAIWDETGVYTADLEGSRPKYIAMSMFNYPSGAGIHIGHAMNYTISDVKARFKRQQGFESYHPVGWDSFGLPAENYAIKAGVSPQESMATIIPGYHKQYKAMGWSNDWEKEIATHLPEYYKWTQWIFAQMYQHGLAYQDSRMQWWCEKDATVLANEQVIDGKCWRHDGPDDPLVEKKEIKQWFFKITEYADELLEATDTLDWTPSVKLAQKNWIGKSKGAEVAFAIDGSSEKLTVFTTRPDTLYGATFMVLAPEHPLIETIVTSEHKDAVEAYKVASAKKTEVQRQENKEKTGEFTGAYAINPVNGEKLPIWTADYVLLGYGTGAIMAVPAHDERDYEFAKTFDLPVRDVVAQDFGEKLPDSKQVEGVVVIGYDPNTKQYMSLKNGSLGWLVAGGREDGEEFDASARRELREEAGYGEVTQLLQLGAPVYSYYYNDIKQSNRRSLGYNYVAILDSTKQGEQQQESHEKFDVVWRSFDETYADIEATKGGVEHWLDALLRAKQAVAAYEAGRQYAPIGYHGEGVLINSGEYDGIPTADAREKIVADLEKKGTAKVKINYRMRDWSVSRQRYWGAPIPIIHCVKCGNVLVPDDQLPVVLPELDDFAPSGDGRSALARAKDWLYVDCPQCGGPAERETDTLDTYICSSWYMFRYLDPHNQQKAFGSTVANKWMPIDFYNGADHATAHLLYARFVARFFTKIGLVNDPEPFKQFLFNGKVTAADGQMFSKSKGNGIDPLEIIEQGYGADALRTYLMFAAPLEVWAKWDSQGVPGTHRFLSRIWNLVGEYNDAGPIELTADQQRAIRRATHVMIRKVTDDIEGNRYNTAIAAAMSCVNELYKLKVDTYGQNDVWHEALASLVACVAPFAPHIAEDLWHQLGHSTSINRDSWPKYDEQYLVQDTVTVAVQVNGKLRGTIEAPVGSDEAAATELAKADVKIAANLDGKQVIKAVYVPNKLLNFVVK